MLHMSEDLKHFVFTTVSQAWERKVRKGQFVSQKNVHGFSCGRQKNTYWLFSEKDVC